VRAGAAVGLPEPQCALVPLSGYLNLSARWCRFRATGLPYMTQSEVGTVSIQLWMYEHLSGSALIKERSSAVNPVHDRVRLQVEVVLALQCGVVSPLY